MTKLKEINYTVTGKFLRDVAERIACNLKVDKIILFGSYAYGKPHPYSDIDLLIIMKSKERESKRIINVSRLLQNREVPMDFLVKTPSEVKKRLSLGDPFIRKVLKEGKVLYEKENS
ncbi:MAG: nucleotidyltransferase domain-containing protein [bacterium]